MAITPPTACPRRPKPLPAPRHISFPPVGGRGVVSQIPSTRTRSSSPNPNHQSKPPIKGNTHTKHTHTQKNTHTHKKQKQKTREPRPAEMGFQVMSSASLCPSGPFFERRAKESKELRVTQSHQRHILWMDRKHLRFGPGRWVYPKFYLYSTSWL